MSASGEGLVGEGWEVGAPTRVQTASRSFARSGLCSVEGVPPQPQLGGAGLRRTAPTTTCAWLRGPPLVSGWAQGARLAFAPGGELAGKLRASPGMVPSVGQVMPLVAP